MILIPAIDIKGGRCVRLRQGNLNDETVFSEDPVQVADRWVAAGARRLHIVDLDGAVAGKPINHGLVADIARNHPDLPIQIGGGIRDEDAVQAYLDAGVRWVIIGTKAVTAPHLIADLCTEFPSHIVVGLDTLDGKVAVDGWSKLSHHDVIDLAQQFEDDGIEAIVHTDIGRDGMLSGVNIESTVALARAIHVPVIASGGITSLDDIRALCDVADEGIEGAITGRAIYEGTLDFADGQRLADERAAAAEKAVADGRAAADD
jgi:phosphoribosylformimino-5-aminoimidazole carboxamide ribotide isomerase